MGKNFNTTSNDQNGGITSGEINFHQPENSIWEKPWAKYFAFPLAVLIMAGLLGNYLTKIKNMSENIFNVTSNNQQGGITAGQININSSQQRHLSEAMKKQLEVYKDKRIIVKSTFGDAESYQFAEEIKEYLKQNGFNVDLSLSSQDFFEKPIAGQEIFDNKDGLIYLYIGSR